MKRRWLCAVISMVFPACLMLGGCGGEKAAEKAAETAIKANLGEQGQEVDVDIDSENENFSMRIQGEQGDVNISAGKSAKLPDTFPKDVPLYPGLELQAVSTMGEKDMFMVQGSTADSVEKVAGQLAKAAQSNGWTETMSMNMSAQQRMLNYGKDQRILHFMVMRDEEATRVSITTGEQ